MILLVDNTKDIDQAKMTPIIIKIIENLNMKYIIVSNKTDLINNLINIRGKVKGIILSGGPLCLSENCNYNDVSKNILTLTIFNNVPALGICFGYQIISNMYGGKISKLKKRHTGVELIKIINKSDLIGETELSVFYSHGDYVSSIPYGFQIIRDSFNNIVGIESKEKKMYGYQFHPEGTIDGQQILLNFLEKYCK